MTPGTELPRDFCAGIGPLQLGIVLVIRFITIAYRLGLLCPHLMLKDPSFVFESKYHQKYDVLVICTLFKLIAPVAFVALLVIITFIILFRYDHLNSLG